MTDEQRIYDESKMKQKVVYPTKQTPSYADWVLFNMGKELEGKVEGSTPPAPTAEDVGKAVIVGEDGKLTYGESGGSGGSSGIVEHKFNSTAELYEFLYDYADGKIRGTITDIFMVKYTGDINLEMPFSTSFSGDNVTFESLVEQRYEFTIPFNAKTQVQIGESITYMEMFGAIKLNSTASSTPSYTANFRIDGIQTVYENSAISSMNDFSELARTNPPSGSDIVDFETLVPFIRIYTTPEPEPQPGVPFNLKYTFTNKTGQDIENAAIIHMRGEEIINDKAKSYFYNNDVWSGTLRDVMEGDTIQFEGGLYATILWTGTVSLVKSINVNLE